MAGSKLLDYLEHIQREEAVNVVGLRRALPAYVRASMSDYFEITPVDAKLSRVKPLDGSIMLELWSWASSPSSRVEAATKGDSHRFVVSKAYLMAFTGTSSLIYPDTVVITGDEAFHGFDPKRRVLLVENEENFHAWPTMLAFANACLGRADLSPGNTDIILASGNRVNKAVTLGWLDKTYTEVLCAFDYDLGGLQMFETLKSTIPGARFLIPQSWERYRNAFCKSPETGDRLRKASAKSAALGLHPLSEMFQTTRKFMEQEMLLSEEFDNGF